MKARFIADIRSVATRPGGRHAARPRAVPPSPLLRSSSVRGTPEDIADLADAADDLAGSDESILTSVGLSAVAGNSGGFLGVSLGALLMHRGGGFDTGGAVWKRLIRSVLGLAFLAGIYSIYHLTLPGTDRELLYSIWRFSGFFILSFSTIFLIPRFFSRLNLLA